jgi:ADP-ribose pyrophosphatase YjhB (NUDIX family)
VLASPSPSLRNTLEEVPWPEPSASPTAGARKVDSQNPMIVEFKEQTKSVAAQVSEATGNFREIDRLDAVLDLPESVTASITALALRARDFRAKLGYEIAFHECRVETETVDALTVVDSIDRDFAGGNAPSARMTLLSFVARYPQPPSANQKPLWRYLTSALSLCNRLKNQAETHLQRARSLASTGKSDDELREYQEINRIYPNPVAAQKIRQLEAQPR